ncbi:ADP-ribosylation factor family-domain-containing protein [Echria macrotheca]|uniref:ADP-ribosylation factor family-domain-containing protein n=1 Tax=Echria macrotheca TaxID=438768 RepID=A0AAJ0B323_9PEZI|nr:ADP-ribosylation factor family-domain-containing protein [Echria macrotheca]
MQKILRRLFSREEQLPGISIMGLDGAGKTTLLYKLRSSEVVTTIPTIGFFIETAKIHFSQSVNGGTGQRFTARVADTGGCAKIYPLVRLAMLDDSVSALVWVIDAHDTERLVESLEELTVLLRGSGVEKEDFSPSMPVLILANKIDLLPNGQNSDSVRAKFEGLLKGRRFAYFETNTTASRSSSSGLEEAFAWLGAAIESSAQKTETVMQKKPVEDVLTDMRSPAALSAKLEDWLTRAEIDPLDAEELLRQFYALNLPSWDHYTHLRLAYTLLLKHGRREGKDKIFNGFKEYIDRSGKIHGKSFHMTMTYFWVQMVHLGIATMNMGTMHEQKSHTLKSGTGDDYRGLANDFPRFLMVNPYLVDGQLWADYYSKEVLMSQEAKEGVMFPDIKRLPDVLYPTAAADSTMEKNDP